MPLNSASNLPSKPLLAPDSYWFIDPLISVQAPSFGHNACPLLTRLHLIGEGGGRTLLPVSLLPIIALRPVTSATAASRLPIIGLVAALGPVGVLGPVPAGALPVACIAVGIPGCGLFLRGTGRRAQERGGPACLLEHEPQIADPEHQVQEAEHLQGDKGWLSFPLPPRSLLGGHQGDIEATRMLLGTGV